MLKFLWFFCVPWIPSVSVPPIENQWGPLVDRWYPLVYEALEDYGVEDQIDTFMRVMNCESRGDPNAHNTVVYSNPLDQASGLMQHMPRWWDERSTAAGFAGYSPFDPVANIYTSVWLLTSRGGGWTHWTCYGL